MTQERQLVLTHFFDLGATQKVEELRSWRSFVSMIRSIGRTPKEQSRLVKFARFDGSKTKKGALRHGAAMTLISGVECDYDDGQVSPQRAAELLNAAGIQALVVTTHSHLPAAPRWRVFAPLSQDYGPLERLRFAKGIDKALGGILATESFTQAQAFYIGGPPGDGEYLLIESSGQTCIDQWPECPAEAHLPTVHEKRVATGDLSDVPKIREALSKLVDVEDFRRQNWLDVGMALHAWQENTEGAGDTGYDLFVEWCHLDPMGTYEENSVAARWGSFTADRGVTLGTLYHRAGMTVAQRTPLDAAAIFNTFPPAIPGKASAAPESDPWTLEPVEAYKGSRDPAELLAELQNSDTRDFSARWAAGDAKTVLEDLCWKAGGCCQWVLEMFLFNPAFADTPELRAWIARNCNTRSTWATVGKLTMEQISVGCDRIEVDDGKLVSAERAIIKALPAFPNLFQRNQQLVSVLPDGRILKHTLHTLSSEVETHIRVEKGGKGVPAKLPGDLMRRVVEREWFPGVGEIKAAVPLPIVRADGSVASEKGLDARTGLYVLKSSKREPRLLDTEEMKAALERVWAPFAEFPFADQSARAVCLAAMFTTVCRPALATSPAFIVNAQTYGTGKTLLSTAILSLTGADVSISAISSDGQEQAKQLTAILDEGPLAVMFDNVKGYLRDSSDFCMALTSPVYKGRLLGQSKMLKLPNRAVWVLNGNNVGVSGDAVRRILPINLCSDENPELKKHSFDPLDLIKQNLEAYRGDLINLLTTYAAYGAAETRLNIGGYASFEDWNRLVRGAVVWYGWGDPIEEMQEQQGEDPEVQKLRILMEAWAARFGTEGHTLFALMNLPVDGAHALLWKEALDLVTIDNHGRENPKKLSYFLKDVKGRALDGRKFIGKTDRTGRMIWRLVDL